MVTFKTQMNGQMAVVIEYRDDLEVNRAIIWKVLAELSAHFLILATLKEKFAFLIH